MNNNKKYNIDTILFDYGGVVAHHYCEPFQSIFADILKVTKDESKKLITEKSEQGKLYRINKITRAEFWEIVTDLANCKKEEISYDELEVLWAKTYVIDTRIIGLIEILRKKNKVCLFSNTDKFRYNYMESKYKIKSIFDEIYCSFKIEKIKPSNEAFNYILSNLNYKLSPEKILFIDDRQSAINAAEKIGIKGFCYKGYDDLVHFLIELNILRKSDFI